MLSYIWYLFLLYLQLTNCCMIEIWETPVNKPSVSPKCSCPEFMMHKYQLFSPFSGNLLCEWNSDCGNLAISPNITTYRYYSTSIRNNTGFYSLSKIIPLISPQVLWRSFLVSFLHARNQSWHYYEQHQISQRMDGFLKVVIKSPFIFAFSSSSSGI